MLKIATNPVTKIDQFIFLGVTSAKLGQKLKKSTKVKYRQAKMLFASPRTPGILHGPQTSCPSNVVDPAILLADSSLAGTMPPVQRRYSNNDDTNKYEENRPAIEIDVIPLNAVADPILTRARRPLSLEKAHKIRDVEASRLTQPLVPKQNINDAITAAPAVELTACSKMAIKGCKGFSAIAASMSPARKSTVRIIAKPSDPLIISPAIIARGTTRAAF